MDNLHWMIILVLLLFTGLTISIVFSWKENRGRGIYWHQLKVGAQYHVLYVSDKPVDMAVVHHLRERNHPITDNLFLVFLSRNYHLPEKGDDIELDRNGKLHVKKAVRSGISS